VYRIEKKILNVKANLCLLTDWIPLRILNTATYNMKKYKQVDMARILHVRNLKYRKFHFGDTDEDGLPG
jgi:hypothetical protein